MNHQVVPNWWYTLILKNSDEKGFLLHDGYLMERSETRTPACSLRKSYWKPTIFWGEIFRIIVHHHPSSTKQQPPTAQNRLSGRRRAGYSYRCGRPRRGRASRAALRLWQQCFGLGNMETNGIWEIPMDLWIFLCPDISKYGIIAWSMERFKVGKSYITGNQSYIFPWNSWGGCPVFKVVPSTNPLIHIHRSFPDHWKIITLTIHIS